jgi:predicted PurR-regulated permease PerM
MLKKRITLIFLIALSVFVLYLCYILFRPFLKPLFAAVVIAVIFFPVQARMLTLVRSPSIAAFLSTLLVTLIIIVPAIMLGVAIYQELEHLTEYLQAKSDESGGWSPFFNRILDTPSYWLSRLGIDVSKLDLRGRIASRLGEVSAFLLEEGQALVGNVISFIVNTVITLFTVFFLFREGRSMRRRIAAVLPLHAEQIDKLFTGIYNTIMATVYGGLVVAAVQGALVGLALWVFSVPSPVLWGVVAAMFSLVPLVGSAAVWLPAAIYLFINGHWVQALVLIAWGGGVVGTIDNVLRPMLMAGRVRMHTLLIFFSVFGGVQVFGFLGLFVGPVIVAITITVLSLLREESRSWFVADDATVADENAAPAVTDLPTG